MGEAAWKGILDRETWEAVVATLNGRGTAPRSSARSYLLPGLLYCGRCGAKLGSQPCHGLRGYLCKKDSGGCNKIRVNADPLEAFVTEAAMVALDSPALARAMRGSADDAKGAEARAELVAAEEGLAELADIYAAGDVTRAEWMRARRGLEQRREAARSVLARSQRSRVLAVHTDGGALRVAWPTLPLAQRRSVLGAVLDRVVIHPAVKGRTGFDQARVQLIWRG